MENYLYTSFAFLIGLCIGSFYCALAGRICYFFYGQGKRNFIQSYLKEKKSFTSIWKVIFCKPSFCFSCKQTLSIKDIIPIWSFFKNRGKCKNSDCQSNISPWLLMGELYCGLVFAMLVFTEAHLAIHLFAVLFCGHLYISVLTDSRYFLLDPENALFLFLWAAIYSWGSNEGTWDNAQNHFFASIASMFVFFVLSAISRFRGLGLGDCLMAGSIALFIGFPSVLIVFQVAALGSILWILVIQKDRKAPAPLGAAMALSTLCVFPFDFFFLSS